jgi:hypothetical protein
MRYLKLVGTATVVLGVAALVSGFLVGMRAKKAFDGSLDKAFDDLRF